MSTQDGFRTGDLSRVFSLIRGEDYHQRMKTLDANYALVPGGAESIGRIATGIEKKGDYGPSGEKQDKRSRRLEDILFQLEQHRRWLLQRMQDLQDQIEHLQHQADMHAKNIQAISDCLNQYQKNGSFDLAMDGYPQNPLVKDLVKDWENRTGESWENLSGEQAQNILIVLEKQEALHYNNLLEEKDKKQQQWDHYNAQRQLADQAIVQVNAASGPDQCDTALPPELTGQIHALLEEQNAFEEKQNLSTQTNQPPPIQLNDSFKL